MAKFTQLRILPLLTANLLIGCQADQTNNQVLSSETSNPIDTLDFTCTADPQKQISQLGNLRALALKNCHRAGSSNCPDGCLVAYDYEKKQVTKSVELHPEVNVNSSTGFSFRIAATYSIGGDTKTSKMDRICLNPIADPYFLVQVENLYSVECAELGPPKSSAPASSENPEPKTVEELLKASTSAQDLVPLGAPLIITRDEQTGKCAEAYKSSFDKAFFTWLKSNNCGSPQKGLNCGADECWESYDYTNATGNSNSPYKVTADYDPLSSTGRISANYTFFAAPASKNSSKSTPDFRTFFLSYMHKIRFSGIGVVTTLRYFCD